MKHFSHGLRFPTNYLLLLLPLAIKRHGFPYNIKYCWFPAWKLSRSHYYPPPGCQLQGIKSLVKRNTCDISGPSFRQYCCQNCYWFASRLVVKQTSHLSTLWCRSHRVCHPWPQQSEKCRLPFLSCCIEWHNSQGLISCTHSITSQTIRPCQNRW